MTNLEILAEYQKNKSSYEDAINSTLDRIEEILEPLNPHMIYGRLKEQESLEHKINKKSYSSLSEITDIAGIRIITHYLNEISHISLLIEREFDIDIKNSTPQREKSVNTFGYDSTHYVINIKDGLKIEIQIRTLLQQTWAEIEHKLQYKNNKTLKTQIQESIYRVKALLETADNEFLSIRKDVASTTSNPIPQSITPSTSNDLISISSLNKNLLESRLISKLDQEILDNHYEYMHYNQKTVEQLVDLLPSIQIHTIADLEKNLYANAEQIISTERHNDAWLTYLDAFPEKYYQTGSIPKGTCIIYLYFLISGKDSLV